MHGQKKELMIEWVLEKAGTDRTLLENIKERKMGYYGHISRRLDNSLEKDLIQGATTGGRERGRPMALHGWTTFEPGLE